MQFSAQNHFVSQILTTQTAEVQAASETLPRLRRLLSDDYTLAEYCELLQLLWAFHEGMELRLLQEKSGPLQQEFMARCNAWKIETDLTYLGVPRNDDLMRRVWAVIPMFTDHNERLGGAYVLEGPLLKGAIVRGALERSLGLGVVRKLLFHADDRQAAAMVWRKFVSLLDAYADHETRTLRGAKLTFRAVEGLLDMRV